MAGRVVRIGKVTNIDAETGKVRVMYEDSKNASLPLSVLSVNGECYIPNVGDRVVVLHMENSGSKGFVVGTLGGSPSGDADNNYREPISIEWLEANLVYEEG